MSPFWSGLASGIPVFSNYQLRALDGKPCELTVADDLVHGCANAPREVAVVQRTRVRVALHAFVMHNLVELECRDSRPDGGGGDVEDLSCELESNH